MLSLEMTNIADTKHCQIFVLTCCHLFTSADCTAILGLSAFDHPVTLAIDSAKQQVKTSVLHCLTSHSAQSLSPADMMKCCHATSL